MYRPFLCEKILTFYVFFSSILQDRQLLLYFGYKAVNDGPIPLKKMDKEEFGMELLSKEYVKIKNPNELI